MSRHTSSADKFHPYQRPEKMNFFWLETRERYWGYSQKTKDYFTECARKFISENTNSKKSQWIRK